MSKDLVENKALFTQDFYNEMMHFCECVLNEKPAEMGALKHSLEVMKVYKATLRSEGRLLKISHK